MSYFMFLTVWMLLLLPNLSEESKCKNKLISSINVTTELQSDVLLPCNFEATLLGSNQTADIAAVWSQRNITADILLEIRQGDVRFWNNSDGRIKTFPELSESGNFSILLYNVQQSDLGLYHCELFEGLKCMTAYQEINLEESKCKNKLSSSINVTTELQSDVLLPCYFEVTLLGSGKTADMVAAWSQRNITDNLVEIRPQGDVKFWDNTDGRITVFPGLSESGNFSILLRNVQQSDVGLYRCELFRGINCIIAYQDIYLSTASEAEGSIKYWHYLLGVAAVLCLLSVSLGYMQSKRNKRGTQEENIYENAMKLRKT